MGTSHTMSSASHSVPAPHGAARRLEIVAAMAAWYALSEYERVPKLMFASMYPLLLGLSPSSALLALRDSQQLCS